MNEQELTNKICDIFGIYPEELEHYMPNTVGTAQMNKLIELIKQDQALREIDIRIDEQNRILSTDYVSVKLDDGAYVDQDDRIKELQAKKDKLIKGVEL